ncbi:glycoside hydrolase family 3 N-terminal domain-containing protein [Georgenia yuyongxinii]
MTSYRDDDLSRGGGVEAAVLAVLAPGFTGPTAPAWLLDAARRGLGGVVLFAGNTPDPATTRALTETLHTAGPDLLVAVDEEGGDVSRLQAAAGSALPGLAALGVVDDEALTRRTGAALGALLRATGVDLDLAPVLDVASEPRNPVIGVRSLGADPALVARHGAALVHGLHDGGVAACGKHFPGHGATTVDSHLDLPELDADLATLRARDLPPFQAAVTAGVDALMTAHVRLPALGARPGTLEPAVTDLARRLGPAGFDGVLITDALDMGAVARDPGLAEAAVQALEAGADLLCLGSTTGLPDDEAPFAAVVAAVSAAVRSGRLDAGRLRGAAARTARLRQRLRGYRAAAPRPAVEEAEATLAAVGAEAARRAVRTHGPARIGAAPVLVDLRRRLDHAAGRTAPALAEALRRRWPGTHVVLAGPLGPGELDAALAGVPAARPVVVLTREPLADPGEQAALDTVLAARPDAVVVHAGTADGAPRAAALVLAHGVGRANAEAVVERLTR